jgi:hypothetical protein
MNNYYQILSIKQGAKESEVYISFKKNLNQPINNPEDIYNLFMGYIILTGPAKNFYDKLIEQEKNGNQLNQKFLNVLSNSESETRKIAKAYINSSAEIESKLNNQIKKKIRSEIGFGLLLTSLIALPLQIVGETSLSTGIALLIWGIISTVIAIFTSTYALIILVLPLLYFGFRLIKKGNIDIERTEFNNVIRPYKY